MNMTINVWFSITEGILVIEFLLPSGKEISHCSLGKSLASVRDYVKQKLSDGWDVTVEVVP